MNRGAILNPRQDHRPNFFIVGAQKCGTTSLAQYLGGHPDIFLSTPKEPFYFAKDIPGMRKAEDLDEYLSFFRDAPGEPKAIGEATAGYLYSSAALRNIREFDADARIIVMLRNPVDLLPSLHSQLLYSFIEDEPDFARAWELQDARLHGRELPKRCQAPEFLQYRSVGMLGAQAERLLTVFPRDQVLFIYFEDFVARTRETYRETLRFLGISDDGRTAFPAANAQKRHRFPWLFAPFSRRPVWVQRGIEKTKALLGPAAYSRLQKIYASPRKREPLPDSLRREMESKFREDIELLSRITGRDLRHWVRESSVATV